MKRLVLALGAATLCSAAALAATHTPVTITGCVRAGADPETFVLLDVDEVTDGRAAPAGAVYRLSSTRGLRPHAGHKVEVRGTYSFDRDFGKSRTLKVNAPPTQRERIYRRLQVNGVKMIGASCDVP
jgi:hypothetical protein